MTADRDLARVVRSWLRTDEHESADRVLDAVLARLDTTPQRPSWRPARRFAEMSNITRLGIAAAAVLAAVVLGLNVLPRTTGIGAQPTPSPTMPPALPSGSLAAGSYTAFGAGTPLTADQTHVTPFPFTVTVPAGWSSGDGWIQKGDTWQHGTGVGLATWVVTHAYSQSCQWAMGTLVPITSRRQLASVLAGQGTHTTSAPTETTLGGLPVTHVTLTLAKDADVSSCQGQLQIVRLWPNPGPDDSGGWPIWPGQTTDVYAIESGGQVVVMFTVSHEDAPRADVAELQSILGSVRFILPAPAASGG